MSSPRLGLSRLQCCGSGSRALVGLLAIGLLVTLAWAQGASAQQWPMGGHDLGDTRNQPLETTIGPSTVGGLTVKWVFTTGGDVSATPAVVNGVVYFPDWSGEFYAVNAANGQLVWSHQIADWTGVTGDLARDDPAWFGDTLILGDQGGQLASFESGALKGPGARLMAVNALTGQLKWVTQVDSFPGAEITGSPVIFGDIVYVGVSSSEEALANNASYPCCSFQGSVVALNAETGSILWKTYDMPASPGNPGGYTGGAVWGSTPVVDPVRGLLYVGTGNNYTVPQAVSTCIGNAQANNQSDSICNGLDNYAEDYFDSVLALNLTTGAIKWADRVEGYDDWTVACLFQAPGVDWCPLPAGPDYDFAGAGPNLLSATIGGVPQEIIGIGQKSGVYWTFDPDNGNVVWNTAVGPGSGLGGIEWGTATDGQRVYVPIANDSHTAYLLQPSGTSANGGSWAALDLATGSFIWQTAVPGTCSGSGGSSGACMALGPLSVANGIVYAGSMDTKAADPTMFALDATSGAILWSFAAGSSVNAAPAVVGNSLYWGAGYAHSSGTGNTKLYAFALPGL